MNKSEANNEAKKIFAEWRTKRDQIEREAKENGTWQNSGLDSNNHLFKDIDAEAKEKLKSLSQATDKT